MAIYLRGIGGAPGIGEGRAVRYEPHAAAEAFSSAHVDDLLAHFARARDMAALQLRELGGALRAEGRENEAAIFDAQALLVEEPFMLEEVERRLRADRLPLDQALALTIAQMRGMLDRLDDPYLSARAADLDMIGRAIMTALYGATQRIGAIPGGAIVVASDLSPSEIFELRNRRIAGFVTAGGSAMSHSLILARALAIPAVFGLGGATRAIPEGAPLILDGTAALLIVDPDPHDQIAYQRRTLGSTVLHERERAGRDEPGQFADGHRIGLWANIGHPDEAPAAIAAGAEGIGLFRTEFLFLNRATPPDEEEQYRIYRATLKSMADRPVIIRTIDIGGDKLPPYLSLPHESNPALGMRGLRLSIEFPALLEMQLRALLRAARYGDLRIMFPMVTTPDDLAWGRQQIRRAAEALDGAGIEHRFNIPVGAMIETPAAALLADMIAPEVAFISVGTNDLAQYVLAADRGNAALATRYPHDSPAVLRLIARAIVAARRMNVPASVCGELAGDAAVAPLLIGMGADTLSMAPEAIAPIKEQLRSYTLAKARAAARHAIGE
jgi:phosphotransferase system enzyme I (PtsI)